MQKILYFTIISVVFNSIDCFLYSKNPNIVSNSEGYKIFERNNQNSASNEMNCVHDSCHCHIAHRDEIIENIGKCFNASISKLIDCEGEHVESYISFNKDVLENKTEEESIKTEIKKLSAEQSYFKIEIILNEKDSIPDENSEYFIRLKFSKLHKIKLLQSGFLEGSIIIVILILLALALKFRKKLRRFASEDLKRLLKKDKISSQDKSNKTDISSNLGLKGLKNGLKNNVEGKMIIGGLNLEENEGHSVDREIFTNLDNSPKSIAPETLRSSRKDSPKNINFKIEFSMVDDGNKTKSKIDLDEEDKNEN